MPNPPSEKNYYRIADTAQADMEKLDAAVVAQVTTKFAFLNLWPNVPGAKALVGPHKGKFRLRAGDWRILYHFDRDTQRVTVLRVEHRSRVYDRDPSHGQRESAYRPHISPADLARNLPYQYGRALLAQKLRTLRLSAGLSQTQTAERLGVSQSAVSGAEHARFIPGQDYIRSLQGLLHRK